MLEKATADPAYGADFKTKVVANTVSQEDNVRQVVSKVQLGEADAAVVYSTDATPQVRDQLQIIQVPDPLQTLATYPTDVVFVRRTQPLSRAMKETEWKRIYADGAYEAYARPGLALDAVDRHNQVSAVRFP